MVTVEQLYIARKEQEHNEYLGDGKWFKLPSSILGYGSRYNPGNKTCDKKNAAQDDWAKVRDRWDPTTSSYIYKPSMTPLIVNNEPLTGFEVATFVSRYSTSNKLWRIRDPRGFELEITTANMETLLTEGSVIKGVFQDKMVWDFGKNGIGKAKLVIYKEPESV